METADPTTGSRPGRPARPAVLVGVLAVALAVIATVVLTGHGHRHDGAPDDARGAAAPGFPGQDRDDGPAAFRTSDADTLVLDGVSGRIRVTADADAHAVSGTFKGADAAAGTVRAVVDAAAGRRSVSIVCATGDGGTPRACAGDLSLTVPLHTGLRLRQTSGETVLDGLGGALVLSTASDRLTANALRTPSADVTVTSGSADIGFAAPPRTLAVQTTSASTAIRLPAGAGDAYAVTSAATSADVRIQVPRRDDAAHRVTLRVLSGSLAVLPA